eukprot:8239661-Pyramimonas_sp.AAC.1
MTSYPALYSTACSSASLVRATRLDIVSRRAGGVTRSVSNRIESEYNRSIGIGIASRVNGNEP